MRPQTARAFIQHLKLDETNKKALRKERLFV